MKHVRLSRRAESDLQGIWLYVAKDSPAAADRLMDRIYKRCRKLHDFQEIGRTRNELAPGLRGFPAGRYVVFYRSFKGRVEIVRVLAGDQDIDAIFGG